MHAGERAGRSRTGRVGTVVLFLAVAMGLMVPAVAAQGGAGPWPQVNGDSGNTRQGVADGPGDPGIKWFVDDREETGDLQGPDAAEGFDLSAPDPVLTPDGILVVTGSNRTGGGAAESGSLIGIDTDDGSLAWHLPHVITNCAPVVDSDGEVWVHRHQNAPGIDNRALQAVDASTGEAIAGSAAEDVAGCGGTQLHLGGAADHIAWMDGGGASRADTLAVYDVSGAPATEAFTIELGDTDFVGNSGEPAIVFTDDSLIVPRRGEVASERVVQLVEYMLADGSPGDTVTLPLVADDPDDIDGDDQDAIHVLKAEDDTLIVGVDSFTGSDADPYIARIDWAGPSVAWTATLESTSVGQMAIGEGFVATQQGQRASMRAYALDDGDELWTVPSRNSHLVTDLSGDVYTSTQFNSPEAGGEAALSSYSSDGSLRWQAPVSGINGILNLETNAERLSNGAAYGPIDDDGTLYMHDSGKILALDNSGGLVTDPVGDDDERVSGPNRIATSVELSQLFDSADTVVLARSDEYPDALAGAPLATALEAPILLTPSTSLAPSVATEIGRLGATTAVLLGGEAALSPAVETALGSAGVTSVQRYAGSNRFDTAAQIAQALPDPSGHAYVVEGQNADPNRGWPDAVAVSALAAYTETPILLATQNALPAASAGILDDTMVSSATLVGGTAALSTGVESLVNDMIMDADEVDRVSGPNRYATSAAIAELSILADMDPSTVWLATGGNWPDSLSAAPVAGSTAPMMAEHGGILLLVNGQDLDGSAASRDWIAANSGAIDRIRVVGGSAVVTSDVAAAARALIE